MKAGPRPIDVYIGRRLSERRSALGLTQNRLAELLNIPVPQLQDYEDGTKTIPSTFLLEAAYALNIRINWFFEGFKEATNMKRHDSSDH